MQSSRGIEKGSIDYSKKNGLYELSDSHHDESLYYLSSSADEELGFPCKRKTVQSSKGIEKVSIDYGKKNGLYKLNGSNSHDDPLYNAEIFEDKKRYHEHNMSKNPQKRRVVVSFEIEDINSDEDDDEEYEKDVEKGLISDEDDEYDEDNKDGNEEIFEKVGGNISEFDSIV